MPPNPHKQQAQSQGAVPVAVVTVSDTRTPETDTSGQLAQELLTKAGHQVCDYRLVRDEPDQITALLDELADGTCKVIIFNGGTGIAPRDTTYDALTSKLEKILPGFGELFRMLSYAEVGASAMLSRATAGLYKGKIVFSTPGSPNAVQVALEKLILPELQHLAWEIMR